MGRVIETKNIETLAEVFVPKFVPRNQFFCPEFGRLTLLSLREPAIRLGTSFAGISAL
jgi:hypothetical protein